MRAGLINCILTPMQGNVLPDGVTWCADNGCYGRGYPGDVKWFAWLTKHAAHAGRCLFAVAPDVLCDATATLRRGVPWLSHIRELGYPAAFVAQDGQELLPVPWDEFDVLFIGGSTDWKLSADAARIVRDGKRRGKSVHMGRVNSLRRIMYAHSLGVDTVDGTFISFGPSKRLPEVLGWLESTRP